ncbi:helix-turn-helix domain-containing protein [Pedobacter sp. B4-66]|uniref:XRE family transcriptional regulator n=1 Tax=Pedobacter sp. B4-66 TaxID=2817280 RepID=UPI001BD9B3E9|nr:helix-turn-helix domain-containing protein [Pedobacter sp. B4-66]
MKEQKVFFPSNIRFLRERKKLTQEHMANILGISRSKLNALESGQTKAPQPEDFLNFSEYFKISVDTLLKVDLSRMGELKLRQLEAGNDIYMTGSKLRILAITVDKNNKENLEYVPVKAKAGYSAGFNDPTYIANLPSFSMPNLPHGTTFRMFPTVGDSMLPIPEGSDIICRFIENWAVLKPRTLCIAVLKGDQDFVFKQVTLDEKGLLMESLNPEYKSYTVPISEVLELWEFQRFISNILPEIQPDLQSISKVLREIQGDINSIKERVE